MLFLALVPLADEFILFNLFRYLTFRSGGACMTALFLSFALGGPMIRRLRRLQANGQPMREQYMTETHLLGKRGTPTMGGVLILIALVVATLLWADLRNGYVWAVLVVTVGYGLLGFADDFLKVTKRNTRGVPAWAKLAVQGGLGVAAAAWMMVLARPPLEAALAVPFLKDLLIQLGWLFVPFGALVMIGASNAVNLTDGLDGLAIVPVMIAAAVFALIAYLTGNAVFANYLQLHFVAGAGELAVLCAALIGAGMGFLWFNAPPAMVFMGDTGSLALGGALGSIAVATKHELVLLIVGGLFVLETVSVIVQVVSFKLTGRRVFRMAPLHHHFEKKGWAESTIVIRFWIIAMILALVGLSTLKLR
ncbi:phospho-N-acetylmuramoyl-pentapeptide-transferase [Elioraea sp. Yellowstone]|jgi:phospho-N-acetylmuramoyl-pentapeptide-transferase|uniref:phospho-N-acetylmuramoyl-pentapeptide- transferase n=1 Tax=Elioraea sp. Yellowstone TaxID=2592070 RepID=UPI00114DE56B|nr:phospho-N-acetylmuramoyl-pentapeptide-transferase [Elioraea sp. Yellowstone]TQF76567.1 phospho-N-acetylmuramoyl-pentapeptide-transferase [Elioraea sp. Yellowstone]